MLLQAIATKMVGSPDEALAKSGGPAWVVIVGSCNVLVRRHLHSGIGDLLPSNATPSNCDQDGGGPKQEPPFGPPPWPPFGG